MALLRQRHVNSSIGTTAEQQGVIGTQCYQLIITNTHASQTLSVSFDNGLNYYVMAAGATITITAPDTVTFIYCDKLWFKGSGAATTYELLISDVIK